MSSITVGQLNNKAVKELWVLALHFELKESILTSIKDENVLKIIHEYALEENLLVRFPLSKCLGYSKSDECYFRYQSWDPSRLVLQPIMKCQWLLDCQKDRHRMRLFKFTQDPYAGSEGNFECNDCIRCGHTVSDTSTPNDCWLLWQFHPKMFYTWGEDNFPFWDTKRIPYDKSGVLIHKKCAASLGISLTLPVNPGGSQSKLILNVSVTDGLCVQNLHIQKPFQSAFLCSSDVDLIEEEYYDCGDDH